MAQSASRPQPMDEYQRREDAIKLALAIFFGLGLLLVALALTGVLPRTFWWTGIASGMLCAPVLLYTTLYHPSLLRHALAFSGLAILGVSQSLLLADMAISGSVLYTAEVTQQVLFAALTGVFSAVVLAIAPGVVIGRLYDIWINELQQEMDGRTSV